MKVSHLSSVSFSEENLKLHTSMISWMVHLLVKGGTEAPSDSWDHEFHLLNHEVYNPLFK